MKRSLAGSVLALFAVLLVVAAGIAAGAVHLRLGPWIAFLAVLLVGLAVGPWIVGRWLRPVRSLLLALEDALRSFRDGDFSIRLDARRQDELGELARLHNATGDVLRDERIRVRQRELLLATALDESPVAILLVNPLDRILYANREARTLLVAGRPLVGLAFAELAEQCPQPMRELLAARQDGVFSVAPADGNGTRSDAGERQGSAATGERPQPRREAYHLLQKRFLLDRRPHRLLLVRRITPELARQEAEIWKRVIRVLAHELNNSLAPIASLLHSAELLVERGDPGHRLRKVFPLVRDRIDHLTHFLEGYAHFARLPRPEARPVRWEAFLAETAGLLPFRLEGEVPPGNGFFDPVQLQQVLINLLKNAAEASEDGQPGDTIAVRVVETPDGGQLLQVLDRGRGLTPDQLTQAVLPFYSTKREGGGLGLALCREIVEAHGGRLAIQGREGGGTIVSCWLPGPRLAADGRTERN